MAPRALVKHAAGNRSMALLPCLRWGDARWWLPLRSGTAERLAAAMMSEARPLADSILHDALERDPALLIFVALRWSAARSSRAGKRVALERLAEWFAPRQVSIFSDGDAFLGQPQVSSEMLQRWRELSRRTGTFPQKRFRKKATQWLQVAGREVPEQWKACWPRPTLAAPPPNAAVDSPDGREVAGDESGSLDKPEKESAFQSAVLSLPHLARQIAAQRSLRQRFDEQLRREKLASLKQFAYGLSHEINNPLANIVTRTQQLQRGESDAHRRESLEKIVGQSMRAHEMIADVMFYAHPPRPNRERVCLKDVIERAVQSFLPQCEAASIHLGSEFPSSEPIEVWADAAMLHDASVALLRNAVEAIGCDGAIRVEAGRRGKRQQKAFIRVADSGPGLSEEALRHAFDPYYSGREAGRGLGLGLCRVYRVAKLHGGNAKLTSGAGGCVAKMWIRADSGAPG